MNIEEIMKPYFDKKEEMENKSVVDDTSFKNEITKKEKQIKKQQNKKNNKLNQIEDKESQINLIKLRLNKLREDKEAEIEEYVNQTISNSTNFYSGYGAMVKKDLQQAYLKEEQKYEEEINKIYNEVTHIKNEINQIDAEVAKIYSEIVRVESEFNQQKDVDLNRIKKFNRVDIRELANIKTSLVKPLINAKKELEIQLHESQIRNEIVMLKLSEFKYQYDENGKVLNGNEFKNLFEQSNELVEKKYNLQSQIEKVNKYINLMELTQEEINVLMIPMTSWEKEEYDRRKSVSIPEANNEELPPLEEVVEESEDVVEPETIEPKEEVVEEIQVDNDVNEETVKETNDEFDSYESLFENIYEDVLNSASKLRSVKLEGNTLKTMKNNEQKNDFEGETKLDLEDIKLPDGSYLYQRDIKNALNNYKEGNKGRTFKVKGIEQNFEVTNGLINKIKSQLKKCSIISLFSEKKLGKFDIMKVYGKEKSEEYLGDIEIGEIQAKTPEGEYINLQEFAQILKETFKEKSLSWTEKLKRGFNNLFYSDTSKQIENLDINKSSETKQSYVKTR